jgi:hypothetical protein
VCARGADRASSRDPYFTSKDFPIVSRVGPVLDSGYEQWSLSTDRPIMESKGHYDEAEYRRQMSDNSAGS